jgi:eukaryotic-like serine/threonine-protein kinase
VALTESLGETNSTSDLERERAVLESESVGGGSPDDLLSAMTQTLAPTLGLEEYESDGRSREALEIHRSSEPDDRAGDIIRERYELVRLLGKGGMGTVYMARHTKLPKTFAVKVLNRRYAKRKDIAERFLLEARAVSLINHENVVGVIDFGSEPDGSAFLVMEHLSGESLATVCNREAPFAWPRIAHIMGQICRALQAAHDVGIVHRDIKPENVLRVGRHDDPDFIKVLDFGLAKLQVSGGLRLTRTGMVLGTPDYMSPEQARGRDADHRADIYASGILMYELLCGRVPFQASTFAAMRQMHLLEIPEPPSSWAPGAGISPEMDAIVLRALAKDPDNRFASMAQMGEAIAAVGSRGSAPVELLERRGFPLLIESKLVYDSTRRGPRGSAHSVSSTIVLESEPGAEVVQTPASEPSPRSHVLAIVIAIATIVILALVVVAVSGGLFELDPLARVGDGTEPIERSVAPEAQAAPISLRLHTNVPVTVVDARGQLSFAEPTTAGPSHVTHAIVPRSDVAVQLVLRAEGYRDLHVIVTPNQDQHLEFVLEQAPAAPPEPTQAPEPSQAPEQPPAATAKPKPKPKPEPKPPKDHSFAPEIVDPFNTTKTP